MWSSFGSWKTLDGRCYSTEATYLLLMRALTAQVETPTEAADAAIKAWMPTPAELLHITEFECVWRAAYGAFHPALVCATLAGERLGDWPAAVEVAAGVLGIEAHNPLLRVQAHRLLGRAKAELGERGAACEAAECAAAEAAAARYTWLEMMALSDGLKWMGKEGGEEAEAIRARLRSVTGKMTACKEELAGVLGEGVDAGI
jgi:hypothetical protein